MDVFLCSGVVFLGFGDWLGGTWMVWIYPIRMTQPTIWSTHFHAHSRIRNSEKEVHTNLSPYLCTGGHISTRQSPGRLSDIRLCIMALMGRIQSGSD
ncbi:hypothetical protein HOY82DRAFT_238923 [Tuber indicum]|nr:hypothetical protein HOY82DRAFT_238923 [Tuber indicum]